MARGGQVAGIGRGGDESAEVTLLEVVERGRKFVREGKRLAIVGIQVSDVGLFGEAFCVQIGKMVVVVVNIKSGRGAIFNCQKHIRGPVSPLRVRVCEKIIIS